jgi:hypothetical protein
MQEIRRNAVLQLETDIIARASWCAIVVETVDNDIQGNEIVSQDDILSTARGIADASRRYSRLARYVVSKVRP